MTGRFDFARDLVQETPWPIPRRVFVIAEIGINHNGDLSLAKQLINQAKAAGCDAVKFQKRDIDQVYTAEYLAGPRESPWGTTQREQKAGLEFGEDEYNAIDAYCRHLGIPWFASAWDVDSLDFLARYDLPYNKVASAMVTHPGFMEAIAREGKPTFLSTGMCGFEEVDTAVRTLQSGGCEVILLHSVSTYPAAEEDLNLAVMASLRERYGLPVGYSGHEASVSPSVVAASMGAVAIERHITLDRAMYGSDQAASLELSGLLQLVGAIRKIPMVVGDGTKRVLDAERSVAAKLRYWEEPSVQVAG
ncbi:MAG: N-acetylneuraminate synthase [Rhodothermales bacterium]|nr:N-acetylneuraminate synthase [Rhodothermales bacterium]